MSTDRIQFAAELSLGGIIARLESEDPARVLPFGFADPHSYRGYYEQLAFEPSRDITIGEMLNDARSALGATYEGYKGGYYTMTEHTTCWIAYYGSSSDNLIGPLLLELLLAQPAPNRTVAASPGKVVTADYWARRAGEHRRHAQDLRERAAGTDDADECGELERSAIDADLLAESCDRNARLYDRDHPARLTIEEDGPAGAVETGPDHSPGAADVLPGIDPLGTGMIETLYDNPWLSLRVVRDPARGVNGYVFSHEKRCQGRIVAVLPYRETGLGRAYLVRQETTPCWSMEQRLSALTGGYEGGDIEDDAVREVAEESGYAVSREDLIDLGTSYASKSSDTIYSLFAVDVTGNTPSEATGDGSRLESEGSTVWLLSDALAYVKDPQVALMYVRLELRSQCSPVRPRIGTSLQ